jgi:hypoxanthine phosphoribosyltransferase
MEPDCAGFLRGEALWADDIAEVLVDEPSLRARVGQLAGEIAADHEGTDLLLIATLKGAIVFTADLMRSLRRPVALECVCVASYGTSDRPSGSLEVRLGPSLDLAGRHVVVVEDIVDTGRTLVALTAYLRSLGPATLRTCCLLDKPSRREVPFVPDYVGFEIPDRFVVGYGLDFAEGHRNLPVVAALKPDVCPP